LYTIWVKIGEALPWIELDQACETREEAKEAAKKLLSEVKMKIVNVESGRRQVKAVLTVPRRFRS